MAPEVPAELFPNNSKVRTKGLVKKPDENGKEGIVVGFSKDKGRYEVRMPSREKPFTFKPENLELIPSVPKEEKRKATVSTDAREQDSKEKKRKKASGATDAPEPSSKEAEEGEGESTAKRRRKQTAAEEESTARQPLARADAASAPQESTARQLLAQADAPSGTAPPPAASPWGAMAGPGGACGSSSAASVGRIAGTQREVIISKAMSRVLRHSANSVGLHVRADGFCFVQELLALRDFTAQGCTIDELRQVVETNSKRRFELREEGGVLLVRALQGHSLKQVEDESLLKRLFPDDANLPKICVHGTYRRHVDSIKQKGLLADGKGAGWRKHVHFAPYEPGSKRVISGMRADCEVAVYVDIRAALRDGVPFFVSANEVILSPGIEGAVAPRYLTFRDL